MNEAQQPHVALVEATSCRGCGAPLDPAADEDGYLECAYCGQKFVDPRAPEPPPEPEIILIRESELPLSLPTRCDEGAARAKVGQFLTKGLFAPGDLSEHARLGKLAWSLVPTWTGSATTMSSWTAEVGSKKGDKVVWRKAKGKRQHHYADLVAVAGPEVWRSGPSDKAVVAAQPLFAQARRDHYLELQSSQVVPVRMSESAAAARIEGLLKGLEQRACRREVGSMRVRGFRADTTIGDLDLELVHVPVWHGHYGYRDKQYAVYVNAATGQAFGRRPVSAKRVGIAVAIAAVLVAIAGLYSWRQEARKEADAKRKVAAAQQEKRKSRQKILTKLRAIRLHPKKMSDAHLTSWLEIVEQLEPLSDAEKDMRAFGVKLALELARRRLADRRPARAALAFKRATKMCGVGDGPLCRSVGSKWRKLARQRYANGHKAFGAKKLYEAKKHLRVASALLAPLVPIAAVKKSDKDLKDLAASANRTLAAIEDALKKRYNVALRLMLFNDADGDPWDRGDAPDPEVTIDIAGRRAEIKEQVGKDRFEIQVPLELTDGAKVRVEVRERDGGRKFERVGAAEGTYKRGKPLWLKAGWAYVQVLTRRQARGLGFKTFVARARRRQRRDRIAYWAGTTVRRGKKVRFEGSEIAIAKKRHYRRHRSKAAHKAFCGSRVLKAPHGGYFVELLIRQKHLGQKSLDGLRKDRLFGGVTAVLMTADGRKLTQDAQLARCLYRGSEQLLQTRRPGQSHDVLLAFAVPKTTSRRDLYLQVTGPAGDGSKRLTRRMRIW